VIVTSDNPRTEAPESIIAEILAGARAAQRQGCEVRSHVDRAAAIDMAIAAARPGDVVIIAGKGHETYQQLGDRKIDFDDRAVARAALARHLATPESEHPGTDRHSA